MGAILKSTLFTVCQYRLRTTTPFQSVQNLRRVRNVLIFKILVDNGQRTGAILGITPTVLQAAEKTERGAILTVSYFSHYLLSLSGNMQYLPDKFFINRWQNIRLTTRAQPTLPSSTLNGRIY